MRRFLLFLALLLLFTTAALSWGFFRFNQNIFSDTPYKLEVCGRTYVNPATHGVTRDAVDTQGLTVQAQVRTWRGKKNVWGEQNAAAGCGPGVFLEVNDNDFRGYNLSGSP